RDIDPREHDAVLFVGGHGTMWDFANDEAIATIIREIDAQGGIVAAVCHGPAALVQATRADGTPLVAGRRIATFTDAEERAVGLHETVPFLLESTLAARGAQVTAAAPWQANVVVDGRLITGQNPASARGVGEAMAAVLAARVPHAA
nr:type 1 glutamine amidotransferase domain-containing protein [Gemmatimonadaceae bacterium]